ncbi:MAG: hypothetical protein FWC15_02335 [Fibromonadales bacterium]|nr:hypothetical protein [Fibromonadales bacterium]
MKNKIPETPKILLILIITVQTIYAAKTVAVLEIIPKAGIEIEMSTAEMRHLTDELRRQAIVALPRSEYSVLTRDNMIALLPPDEEEAECLAESCAVDIGRAIGAEYISAGQIGLFSGDFTLSIELYETLSGKLLGSIVMESPDIRGLLTAIRAQAPALFAEIKLSENVKKVESVELKVESEELKRQETQENNFQLSTLNSQSQKKSKTPFYVALGLDIVGAAILGVGLYTHMDASDKYDKYKNMPPNLNEEEYSKVYKDVDAAKADRNIFYAIGSALLVTGIAVHIYF